MPEHTGDDLDRQRAEVIANWLAKFMDNDIVIVPMPEVAKALKKAGLLPSLLSKIERKEICDRARDQGYKLACIRHGIPGAMIADATGPEGERTIGDRITTWLNRHPSEGSDRN